MEQPNAGSPDFGEIQAAQTRGHYTWDFNPRRLFDGKQLYLFPILMKQYLKYIGGILLFTAVAMVVLDALYTATYRNCKPRNKMQYIYKMQPRQIDYVFLGSSRTANTIIASDVEKITGKRAINLGIEGAELADNLLELKLLVARGVKMEKVLLQVDYVFGNEKISEIANQAALPFIHDTVVANFLRPRADDFTAMANVPFYRYMKTDFMLGFREFFFSAAGKTSKVDLSDGYIPLNGNMKENSTFHWPATIAKDNKVIEEIREICAKNNVELVLFCAPMCSAATHKEYVAELKQRLPDLHDFSAAIPDSEFYNCRHINANGAKQFTAFLARECLSR
jgi:hypothetical protein